MKTEEYKDFAIMLNTIMRSDEKKFREVYEYVQKVHKTVVFRAKEERIHEANLKRIAKEKNS